MAPPSKQNWPPLGKLSREEFLARYWQKKPVLLKGALKPFPEIITPEELGGLSLDERVESRLIIQGKGKKEWQLHRGPFKPSTFKKLPKKKWTVLVNGVDRFVPSVHQFLDLFSFIPFWRMDDIMISYAVDQGNVGAHVDNFDVFLVQALGKREWMIEDRPVHEDDFIPNLPIRLLRKFKPTHKWVLEPGDILYLPPRFPHHGIARGDRCMTISVGCRAPTVPEILNSVVSKALSEGDDSLRYSDPDLKPQAAGEIAPEAIKKVRSFIEKAITDDTFIGDWLGSFTTDPYSDVKLDEHANATKPAKVPSLITHGNTVTRTEGSRIAFVKGKGTGISLYVNGEKVVVKGKAAELGQLLANHLVVPCGAVEKFLKDRESLTLLANLLSSGAIVVE
jgi:50S ribosomal protein L16 3-hydroxylase